MVQKALKFSSLNFIWALALLYFTPIFASNGLRSCIPLIDILLHEQFNIEASAAQSLAEDINEKLGPQESDEDATRDAKLRRLKIAVEVLGLLPTAKKSADVVSVLTEKEILDLFETMMNPNWLDKIFDDIKKNETTPVENYLLDLMREKTQEMEDWNLAQVSLKLALQGKEGPPSTPPPLRIQKKIDAKVWNEVEQIRKMKIYSAKEFLSALIEIYEKRINSWNTILKASTGPVYILKRVGIRFEIRKLNDFIKILSSMRDDPNLETNSRSWAFQPWITWRGLIRRNTNPLSWGSFLWNFTAWTLTITAAYNFSFHIPQLVHPKPQAPIMNPALDPNELERRKKDNERIQFEIKELGQESPFY